MTKKEELIVGTAFYGLLLLWATVFTLTMWRLNALSGPHWLKICYLAVAIAWVPMTILLVVFLRGGEITVSKHGMRLWTWTVCALGAVCLAFIGSSIVDIVYSLR